MADRSPVEALGVPPEVVAELADLSARELAGMLVRGLPGISEASLAQDALSLLADREDVGTASGDGDPVVGQLVWAEWLGRVGLRFGYQVELKRLEELNG
jgi:hypothetical protein